MLRVWHLARALAVALYHALPEKRARRVPGLRGQAMRAITSVEWNIAEGCGRSSRVELLKFLETAVSSLNEAESQLSYARDVRVIETKVHSPIAQRIVVLRRMLIALMRTIQHRIAQDESRRRTGDNAT